ncbi:MAG: RagB/SusD family nutrient uptake outer membrane protein [Chryseolinea sp.]
MKFIRVTKRLLPVFLTVAIITSCDDKLNEGLDKQPLAENIDYTRTEDMSGLWVGAYAKLYELQWETFPVLAVRGDDVRASGDQEPLKATDEFRYVQDNWMTNAAWERFHEDIFSFHGAIEQILKYKEFAPNPAVADQYIAEIRVMIAFELYQLSRMWGGLLIPTSSQSQELYNVELSTSEQVMQHIIAEIDAAIPSLPTVHPNQRTDLPGGITKHTALAIRAMASLELKDYQGAADATGQIISSNLFSLEPDYYNLFKKPGKLNKEIILELQYSDFNQASGTTRNYENPFFGPNSWTPAVSGSSSGWGFWEPSIKYITFMLDRNEEERLETTVLFTLQGIDSLKGVYGTLPTWVSNTTRDGDIIGNTNGDDESRAIFSSGKHYLPSNQLTPGQTTYGSGKNFICIRYAQILLIHAEALTHGGTSAAMTADAAVNQVRTRAGLTPLTGVTIDNVLDEKFAELAMEWGTRFEDLVRHDRTSELNGTGMNGEVWTYTPNERYLPYPQAQVDLLPQLRDAQPN